ncbi:Lipopolysaccharide export LptBFGC system, permease protein LptF [Abditibacterium utsteinense]|uniref:Lipopolysaccharide export LptBFGC system, permease protein LptF n=1 Tax=Abditibacterium utsteinense TaxID=1960156 RepID=A0A2S8SSV3_9BACT|nr:LptF/LptG family permease [Abditibacterium utsteinense]PQV63819.1 Lipopolysaccharide export LptBFGC system, permease protein LptF [Abditibacterium utsteinense]
MKPDSASLSLPQKSSDKPLQRPAPRSQTRSRRFALPILDRYLLGQVANSILGGLALFLIVLLVAVIITGLQKIVSNGLSAGEFLRFIGLQLPRMIVFALPMAVLFGCVQTFSALAKAGEVVAMQAAGMSVARMLRAPLFCALVATFVVFYLQESLVPRLERDKDAILVAHIQQKIGSVGTFRYEDPPSEEGPLKTLIQARGFDLKTKTLTAPRISFYDADHRMTQQISAELARWSGRDWILQRAEIVKINADKSGGATSAQFASARVELPPPAFLGRSENALQKRLDKGDFLMVSIPEVIAYRQSLQAQKRAARSKNEIKTATKSVRTATFGIHEKIAGPLACLMFALVGVPLGAQTKQRSGGGAMGLSLLVLVFYYVVWTWAATLGRAGALDPVATAYFAVVAMSLGGAWLVRRASK